MIEFKTGDKMNSQDDEGQQGLVLALVFGLIALVLALVIGLAIRTAGQARNALAPGMTPGTVSEITLATPTSESVLTDAETSAPVLPVSSASSAQSAQAALDAGSVKVETNSVRFYFPSGKADLAAGAGAALAELVKNAGPGRQLVITGFHDATGDAASNQVLATQRATSVRDALRAQGIKDSQIVLKDPELMVGAGGNEQARRVEVRLE
jgi:K(+)-stimulated pyrophosphate-energized sodium pump